MNKTKDFLILDNSTMFRTLEVRTRSLLYLLNKLITLQDQIDKQYEGKMNFPKRYYIRRKAIKTVLIQQQEMFTLNTVRVPDRIVSIDKSYIRPIVRGKEVKKVEFGAMVNMIQAGGINFLEHIDFNAFNEGPRLINSLRCGRSLLGKITHVSVDAINAINANRKYCTSQNIITNFKRKGKGRAGKDEEHRRIIAGELSKERATRMEGSFGTEKQHYSLDKIKARTKLNEVLWIFFGVHTANAVRIAKRIAQENRQSKAA